MAIRSCILTTCVIAGGQTASAFLQSRQRTEQRSLSKGRAFLQLSTSKGCDVVTEGDHTGFAGFMLQTLGQVSACPGGPLNVRWRGPCPICSNETDSFGIYFERPSQLVTPLNEEMHPMDQTFVCHPLFNPGEEHGWMMPITAAGRRDMTTMLRTHFRPVARIADRMKNFWDNNLARFDWVLGVHVRATDYHDLGLFSVSPLQHYVSASKHLIKQLRGKHSNGDKLHIAVYVASDNHEAISIMHKELASLPDVAVISIDAFRADRSDQSFNPVITSSWRSDHEVHMSDSSQLAFKVSLGDDVLTDVLLLSRCNVILHWESAVARLAALWHFKATSVTLINTAEYPFWKQEHDFVHGNHSERARLESCYQHSEPNLLVLQYGDAQKQYEESNSWNFDGGRCWTPLGSASDDWQCAHGQTAELL